MREQLQNIKRVSSAKICMVVKADGYGFGDVLVCKKMYNLVDYFAVAKVSELMHLRKCGIYKPVIILSPLIKSEILDAITFSGEISVDSLSRLKETAAAAEELNKIAKIHVQIDTGMHRFGVSDAKEFVKILEYIKGNEFLNLSGVYSHYYSADSSLIRKQKFKFVSFKQITKKMGFRPIFHISASGALPDITSHFDMVRPGIYCYEKNASLESEVIATKRLKKGEQLGYEHAYTASKDMFVATVGIGYGDGVRRTSKGFEVCDKNGNKYKIIGNVCMDCLFIDTGENKLNIGEKITVFGNNAASICDYAKHCGTISYEILTGITKRVKREIVCKSSQECLGVENLLVQSKAQDLP